MARYTITTEGRPIDFTLDSDYVRRTIQNAQNLLMCRMGEVPYDRQRGLDPALFDLPLEEFRSRLLPELDRVMLWEPDAEVVSASLRSVDGEIIIDCEIEISADTWG